MADEQKIDKKTIERLYKRAIGCAIKMGFTEEAYDFAGWIAVRWLEGLSQRQTINQSLIEYLRCEYGNDRRNIGRYKLSRAVSASQLPPGSRVDHSDSEAFDRIIANSGHFETNDPESTALAREAEQIGDGCFDSGRRKQVFSLLRKGLTLKEIGKITGVTESRVSQVIIQMRFKAGRKKNFS